MHSQEKTSNSSKCCTVPNVLPQDWPMHCEACYCTCHIESKQQKVSSGKDCPRCMDMMIKIRAGELKGPVLSCHPLNELFEPELAKFIETREVSKN